MDARRVAVVAGLIGGTGWLIKVLVMALHGGPDENSVPESQRLLCRIVRNADGSSRHRVVCGPSPTNTGSCRCRRGRRRCVGRARRFGLGRAYRSTGRCMGPTRGDLRCRRSSRCCHRRMVRLATSGRPTCRCLATKALPQGIIPRTSAGVRSGPSCKALGLPVAEGHHPTEGAERRLPAPTG